MAFYLNNGVQTHIFEGQARGDGAVALNFADENGKVIFPGISYGSVLAYMFRMLRATTVRTVFATSL